MDSNPDQAVLSELASSALSELLQQQGAGDDPLNLPPLPGETGGPDDQLTGGGPYRKVNGRAHLGAAQASARGCGRSATRGRRTGAAPAACRATAPAARQRDGGRNGGTGAPSSTSRW